MFNLCLKLLRVLRDKRERRASRILAVDLHNELLAFVKFKGGVAYLIDRGDFKRLRDGEPILAHDIHAKEAVVLKFIVDFTAIPDRVARLALFVLLASHSVVIKKDDIGLLDDGVGVGGLPEDAVPNLTRLLVLDVADYLVLLLAQLLNQGGP